MKNNKIAKARIGLIIYQPFFASILLPMPIEEDESIPTMATDGETFKYNPDWIESLTIREITFVLAHETLHCVFDHMGRRGNRSPSRWNQAADYIINEILKNDRVGDMPQGGLYDPKLTSKGGGTTEGVYDLIPEENEQKGPGTPGGALDQVHDAGTNNGTAPTDPAKMAQRSADLRVRVIQAKNIAKMQGKLSSSMERLVNELVEPKFDWREQLRRFISERAKVEATFARPKRRFLGEDLYLPSLSGEKMGQVLIAVDCSGSVNSKLLALFTAEINAIREDVHPSGITVAYFDTEILKTEHFGSDDDLKLNPMGGGGTAFSPIFEHVEEMSDKPVCIIVLTDLYCDDFGIDPMIPVIWCVPEAGGYYNNMEVPFGEVLKVSK